MPEDAKDSSIFDAVARRRERSSELSRRASEQGVGKRGPKPGELGESEDENLMDLASEAAAPTSESAGDAANIDDEVIANLGTGKNDYGVLDELMPQIDFDAIPLTQPKRVMAKGRADSGNDTDVLPDDDGRPNPPPSRAPKRKKKPASLLDSYFKGL